MRPASVAAVIVFSLVSMTHLLRLMFQVEVLVGGATLSMWFSVGGVIVPGGIALALWRDSKAGRAAPDQRSV